MTSTIRIFIAIITCGGTAALGAAAGFLVISFFSSEGPLILGATAIGCLIGLLGGLALLERNSQN
jgi:hypothetical protein